MYYLVAGTGDGSFEWVIEADSEEFARQNVDKSTFNRGVYQTWI